MALDVDALFDELNNEGRWGEDDELGTLNLISEDKVLNALAAVRRGRVVSIGRDLDPVPSGTNSRPIVHRMMYTGHTARSAGDSVTIVPHGFAVTHMDAVSHVYFKGRTYNGRHASEVVTRDGITFGLIGAMRNGIVTRGVLLDVAAAVGVDFLPDDAEVMAADFEDAERLGRARVEPGDAVLVRTGRSHRESDGEAIVHRRAGIGIDALRWLHRRDVAVFGGDCIERTPSSHPDLELPLHEIGLAGMGLALLDWPDVDTLAAACKEESRSDFLLIVAPLRLRGGTGSAVNPIAVF